MTASQKETFLDGGEANAWFERNRAQLEQPSPWRAELALRVAPHIQNSDQRFLEIGCGQGANLGELHRLTGANGAGIEPSQLAVNAGRECFPSIEFVCGTSDALPWTDQSFDMVWFGFCLYLIDRALLFKSIAEADRVLKDGGTLAILDFDPDVPCKRAYHHRPGLWSYKMDYSQLFLSNPAYKLVEKFSLSHAGAGWVGDPQERLGLFILKKDQEHAYREN